MTAQHKPHSTPRLTILLLALIACMVCMLPLGADYEADAATPTPTAVPVRTLPTTVLHVKGNQLVDGSEKPFLLRGAQIESSFNNVGIRETPDNVLYQATIHLTADTFRVMHDQWNMNMLPQIPSQV